MIAGANRFPNRGCSVAEQARRTGYSSSPARLQPAECSRSHAASRPESRAEETVRLALDSVAPISRKGVMMRSIGRRESDSSPPMRVVNVCAARIPDSIRIVDPELPASSVSEGACKTVQPATFAPRRCCRFSSTPRQATASIPVSTGNPHRLNSYSVRDGPSAIAESMAYRCETDLSPGSRTSPDKRRAGEMRCSIERSMVADHSIANGPVVGCL